MHLAKLSKTAVLFTNAILLYAYVEDPTVLSFKKGDILYIIKDGEYDPEEGWIKARNERTGQSGAVSLDAIQILPMLNKPTEETLVTLLFSLTPYITVGWNMGQFPEKGLTLVLD